MKIDPQDALTFLENETRIHRFSKAKFVKKSFLVAFLLHLLLLLCFIKFFLLTPQENQKASYQYSVPSFVYTGALQPTPIQRNNQPTHPAKSLAQKSENSPQAERGLKQVSAASFWGYNESVMDNSRNIMRSNQITRAVSKAKTEEPILLIGDKNADPNPLIILMARALSKNFAYPKYEGHLGIRARVIVNLTLHPEGYFSDPEILESSDNPNFDTAALYAINKAPLVVGANHYLKQPKTYTVGFLFN